MERLDQHHSEDDAGKDAGVLRHVVAQPYAEHEVHLERQRHDEGEHQEVGYLARHEREPVHRSIVALGIQLHHPWAHGSKEVADEAQQSRLYRHSQSAGGIDRRTAKHIQHDVYPLPLRQRCHVTEHIPSRVAQQLGIQSLLPDYPHAAFDISATGVQDVEQQNQNFVAHQQRSVKHQSVGIAYLNQVSNDQYRECLIQTDVGK